MLLGMEFTGLRRALRLSFRHLTPVLHKSLTLWALLLSSRKRRKADGLFNVLHCL
jgi:hypothetical protein